MNSWIFRLCTFLAPYVPKRPHRLDYLEDYSDDPADEFLETFKPNYDGTTFLDDSYFLWLHNRYYWRSGANDFDPEIHEPNLSEDQIAVLLGNLMSKLSLSTPLPLSVVIDEQWRIWQEEPDFPNQEALEAMGIQDLVDQGHVWKDGVSGNPEASSMSNAESVESIEEEDFSAPTKDNFLNVTKLTYASAFADLQ